MEDIQIKLSAIWIALMLVYLLGDVMRIFSGDFKKMNKEVKKFTQGIWLGLSIFMLIPILMILVTLMLENNGVNRSANIIVAIVLFLFNLAGLPTYISWYDRFLIVVGLVFNVLTAWMAWGW